jgi:hypothetical protein
MTFPSPSRATPLEQTNSIVERINRGKVNASIDATLTANAATTTLVDARFASTSVLLFDPLTAHAATELAAGTMYVLAANRTNGSATITHANNAQTDRTFRVLIIG